MTIRYFSVDNLGNIKSVGEQVYVIEIPEDNTAPVTSASPREGNYTTPQNVRLLCNDADGTGCKKTVYTTDGTDPDENSTAYASEIRVDKNTQIRYFLIDNAGNSETIVVADYFIQQADGVVLTVNTNDASGTITDDLAAINCGETCSAEYNLNTQVVLTATHTSGYKPVWSGCSTVTDDQCSIKLSLDKTVSVAFAPSVTENEDNNTISDADLIVGSSIVTAFFNNEDDVDYYKFEVTEPGTFYATISHNSLLSDIYLYNSQQQLIASSRVQTAHTLNYSLTSETYYLSVIPYNRQFDVNNAYELTLSGTAIGGTSLDAYEENDSFTSATEITTDRTVEGYFETQNDNDYFKFDVKASGTFYAEISHNSVTSIMYLYNSSQQRLTNSGVSAASTLSYSLTPGIYYLQVVPYNRQYDLDSSYSLKFSGTVLGSEKLDSNEENDTFSSATEVSSVEPFEGYFDTQNDADYYRVNVTSDTLNISLTHNTVSSIIYIYDSAQVRITNTSRLNAHTISQAVTPGIYYITVTPGSGQYDRIAPYNLEISGL